MQEKSLFAYFKECITSKYIKFEGRARRREYWGFILFSIIIMLSVLIVGSLIGEVSEATSALWGSSLPIS